MQVYPPFCITTVILTIRNPCVMNEDQTEQQSLKQAVGYVLELEAKKEYPVSEIRTKLLKRFDQSVTDRAVDYCTEHGYISDIRYAEMFVRFRAKNSYGPERIRYELKVKGIDDSIISEILENCDTDFDETASEYVCRRYSADDVRDQKARTRIMRHMTGRGFTFDQIRRAMDYLSG